MVRLFVLLAIVVLAVVIVMRLVKTFAATRSTTDSQIDDATRDASEAKLVKCVRCGAFVPRGDALPAPGGFLCSDPKCRSAS
jgi:hypothetical protein